MSNEYALIYLLPEPARSYHLDLWAKVENAFQLRGRTQPKTPPHITLKYQFQAENLDEVERALETFCANARLVPWSLRGFNRFITPDNFVIFLEVIPSAAVRMAHAVLLESLRLLPWMQWAEFDGADLHYHATIANKGLTAANFPAVWSFVSAQPAPDFDLAFDHIALLRIESDAHIVDKIYRLAG